MDVEHLARSDLVRVPAAAQRVIVLRGRLPLAEGVPEQGHLAEETAEPRGKRTLCLGIEIQCIVEATDVAHVASPIPFESGLCATHNLIGRIVLQCGIIS